MKLALIQIFLGLVVASGNPNTHDPPVAVSGMRLSSMDGGDPCHMANQRHFQCQLTTITVFKSRFKMRKFLISQHYSRRKRQADSRTILAMSSGSFFPRWCQMVAYFRVFTQDYLLCLNRKSYSDDPILKHSNPDLGVTVYGHRRFKKFKVFRRLAKYGLGSVTGHVLGQPYSSVHGYVKKNRFYGSIYVKDVILFVEPIMSKNIVRFRMGHVGESRAKRSINAYIYKVYHRTMVPPNTRSQNVTEHPISKVTCRSCSLMLMADYQFYRDVGEKSIKKTVHALLYHVSEANGLLRSQDFDGNHLSDCIGLHVADIRILASPRISLNEKVQLGGTGHGQWTWAAMKTNGHRSDEEALSAEQYLQDFSSLHLDGYCLGVLFSNKAFQSRVLGLAWRGDVHKKSGICQKRRHRVNLKHSSGQTVDLNLNALFITLRTKSLPRIPLRMGISNLVHEILHSFGASHDDLDADSASSVSENRFLMSRFSNTGIHANHSHLSPQSRISVNEVLTNDRMSYCLHALPSDAFCGDGILQPGEQCDCGSVEKCLSERSCCIQPGGGPRKQAQCHLSVPRMKYGQCFYQTQARP